MRTVLASFVIITALLGAPLRAADLAGVWASAVHAEPFVVYDYEPGVVVRTYWLPPWAGRHYFPSGGKSPILGRREQSTATPVAEKRNFRREWLSFPVDTIEQPPFVLNQQHYFPQGGATPPSDSQPSNPPSLK